jgi:dolichol-phosphate mannosyltransferase
VDAPTRVCVVVPTDNEKENIEAVVQATKSAGVPGLTLLFVDDSSPDGTADVIGEEMASEPWVKLLRRKSKLGIGTAYQDGFNEAIATLSPNVLVEMDADLQHPPSLIPSLVGAVRAGADVAVGSRYVEGGSAPKWSLWRRTVSRVANAYSRTLLGIPVRDATSGFRAYSVRAAEAVAAADLPARGFEFQVASLHLLKTKMKIVEVPYSFAPRAAGRSKLGLYDMARFSVAVMRMALS